MLDEHARYALMLYNNGLVLKGIMPFERMQETRREVGMRK